MAVPVDVRGFIKTNRLTEPSVAHSTLRLFFTFGSFVALGSIAYLTTSWPLRVTCWILFAFVVLGAVAGQHEAIHANLYRTKWLNHLCGFLYGSTLLYPYAAFKASHLDHHRWTHAPGDTEPIASFRSFWEYLVFSPLTSWYVLGYHWLITVSTLAGRPPRLVRTQRLRRLVVVNGIYLLMLSAVVVTVTILDWRITVYGWLIPVLIAGTFVIPMVVVPEHYGRPYGPASPLLTTRSVRSNAVIRFLYWGTNFHAPHHLVGSVPSQKLRHLQQYLAERSDIETSYVLWHKNLVQALLAKQIVADPPWKHHTLWNTAVPNAWDDEVEDTDIDLVALEAAECADAIEQTPALD